MSLQYKIDGGDFKKAGYASSQIKKRLQKLNIHPKVIKKIVIALYEAEINVVAYAYDAVIRIEIGNETVKVKIKDNGPGIQDINQAMEKGYSTASSKIREMGFGAGMGLSNMKKNSDKFDIKSKINEGTEINIINYRINIKNENN
ncbi:MAG: ATP-binding protein [Bacteroidetes bacterium]|nr:ATP-binding protein [Bacteroidota bacterium]